MRVRVDLVVVAAGLSDVMWRTHELERLAPLEPWPIRVAESRSVDPDRTGDITWGGGRALAGLVASSGVVRDNAVLELGTGCGIVALTCAKLGARSVLATDVDRAALRRVTAANASIATRAFDVQSDDPLPPCDLLVAADVAYTSTLAAALAARASQALARGSPVVLASAQTWSWDALIQALPRDVRIEERAAVVEPRRNRVRIVAATPSPSWKEGTSILDSIRDGDIVLFDNDQNTPGVAIVVCVLLARLWVLPLTVAARDSTHVYYDLRPEEEEHRGPVATNPPIEEVDAARVRRVLPGRGRIPTPIERAALLGVV